MITLGRAVDQVAVILPDFGSFTAVLVADDGWAADAQVQLRFGGGEVVWPAVRAGEQMRWDRSAADVASVRALHRQSVQLVYQAGGVEAVQWASGRVHRASRAQSCTGLVLGDGRAHTVTPPGAASPVHVLPVPGPPGRPGRDGTGGPGGSATSYEHDQAVPQAVWQVPHQLGRYPTAWSLFDTEGRECGQYVVQHLDLDNLRVAMDVPTAGTFRCI